MKHSLLGAIGGLLVTGSLLAAQANPADQSQRKEPDITVKGCVVQGVGPAVIILENAKLSSADPAAKGKTYVLVADSAAKDLDLKAHVGHEVTVTGSAEMKVTSPPAAGQKLDEKDWPKFTAKSVAMVADRCTTH